MIISDSYLKRYIPKLGRTYDYETYSMYIVPTTELPDEAAVSKVLSETNLSSWSILQRVLTDLALSVSETGEVGSVVSLGPSPTAWSETSGIHRHLLRALGPVSWPVGYENLVIFTSKGHISEVLIISRTELGLDPSASQVEFGTILAGTQGGLDELSN